MRSSQPRFEDFGDLLGLLIAPSEPSVRHYKPLVASAMEIDDEGPTLRPRLWVILHSVTNSGLQLIHARHLKTKKLAVRIESPTGEIVQVLLSVMSTDSRGELYETTAEFATLD
jgi:hypothetical protein